MEEGHAWKRARYVRGPGTEERLAWNRARYGRVPSLEEGQAR